MPNRLLRDGICTSDALNELSPEEEVLFYRLLVVADDYGHMDGRPAILKATCFPLKDSATVKTITAWVDGLVQKRLLARYEAGGKQFIAVMRWECRVRTHPKYPQPSDDDLRRFAEICSQAADTLQTDRGVGMGLGKGKGSGASANDVRFDAAAGAWTVPDLLREQWGKAYPAVDIDRELASASAWLIANPTNQKSNYARFLTNWLKRAQDRAPAAGGGRSQRNLGDDWTGAAT